MKFLFEVIFPKKKFGPLIVDVEDDFIGKNSIFISFSDVDNQDLRISEFFWPVLLKVCHFQIVRLSPIWQ